MIATLVLVLRFILTIALYTFLGWALLTLWQDLRQQAHILSSQKKPGISINIKPDHGVESQEHFSQAEILIGRDTNCDVALLDETLSSHHARINFHHGQWWLEDLGSTNGTFLNSDKLTVPTVIITGDQFKCGNTFFDIRVEVEDKSSPTKKLE